MSAIQVISSSPWKLTLNNPYLEEFQTIPRNLYQFRHRDYLVKKYSWAIPTVEAIKVAASYSPIIEIGAGTGYWAKLLREAGAIVRAFDHEVPEVGSNNNHYHKDTPTWTDVKWGNENELNTATEPTLFLCWPCYDTPFAYDCLSRFNGDNVIFVGEGEGGCTADDKFFDLLYDQFKRIEWVDIPQWWGIHDCLGVYKRKSKCLVQSGPEDEKC